MEIILEVGTPDQQALIRREMELIPSLIEQLDPPVHLGVVILAANFDAKVNGLQGRTDYHSHRDGGDVLAKVVETPGNSEIAIVLSPLLFGADHDTDTRYCVYLHEIMHLVHRNRFAPISLDSTTHRIYLSNLNHYFDEYAADRMAYHLMNTITTKRSPCMQDYLERGARNFPVSINDPGKYERIQSEISQFRRHADVDRFFENVRPDLDQVTICLVHLWALLDHHPEFRPLADLSGSRFVNQRTDQLWNFMKDQYERDSFDLTDGIGIFRDYMENFGLRFEDLPNGCGYCSVLDI